jgi:hypothetical protein
MPYPFFRFLHVIALIVISISSYGQKVDSGSSLASHLLGQYKGSRLDGLRKQLTTGNKDALLQLAPYLDSTQLLSENLGYHLLQTPERTIAYRLIDENCNFLPSEIQLTDSLHSNAFLSFLKSNWDKISFDTITNSFLITPLTKRTARYELRVLSATREVQLNTIKLHSPIRDWMKQNSIEQLIQDGNPIVLLKIAAKLYQGRGRFDTY